MGTHRIVPATERHTDQPIQINVTGTTMSTTPAAEQRALNYQAACAAHNLRITEANNTATKQTANRTARTERRTRLGHGQAP